MAGAFVVEGRPFSYAASFAGDVSKVASWWKLRTDRVIPGGSQALLGDDPGARGIQLYDLLAARAAVIHLRHNRVNTPAIFIGDNQGEIEFMRGDGPMRIEFDGQDVAPSLRHAILKRAKKIPHVDWEWTRRGRNLASDETAKRAAAFSKQRPELGPIFQVTYLQSASSLGRLLSSDRLRGP